LKLPIFKYYTQMPF